MSQVLEQLRLDHGRMRQLLRIIEEQLALHQIVALGIAEIIVAVKCARRDAIRSSAIGRHGQGSIQKTG